MKRQITWRRHWRIAAVIMTVLVTAVGAITLRLFIWPASGAPARASAIVMLEGLEQSRLVLAVSLARQHRAPMLVISQGSHGYGGPCPEPVRGVKLICFDPNPPNTRGEALYVAQLAREYHWTSIILVTNREQDTRGRLLVSMCFRGPIYVDTLPLGSVKNTAYQVAYEWGALVKSLILYHSC
jgi:uncharacterized SAM-binding protein YcdF (DUF218 family)